MNRIEVTHHLSVSEVSNESIYDIGAARVRNYTQLLPVDVLNFHTV